jgi:hypothetical protein
MHGSSVSARALIHGAHAVFLFAPVAILDPPSQDTFKIPNTRDYKRISSNPIVKTVI